MPCNPNRSSQGGDVDGTEATDPGFGNSIDPILVSKASYQTGFPVGHVMDSDGDDISIAEIKQGYTSYGRRKVGH